MHRRSASKHLLLFSANLGFYWSFPLKQLCGPCEVDRTLIGWSQTLWIEWNLKICLIFRIHLLDLEAKSKSVRKCLWKWLLLILLTEGSKTIHHTSHFMDHKLNFGMNGDHFPLNNSFSHLRAAATNPRLCVYLCCRAFPPATYLSRCCVRPLVQVYKLLGCSRFHLRDLRTSKHTRMQQRLGSFACDRKKIIM